MILLFFISSCRKAKDIDKPPVDDIAQKFFQIPEGASEGLISVITDIKKQNDKHHFINQLAGKYGFPAWDKSIANIPVQNTSGNPNARSAAGDSLQLFLIPFRASDSSVSSYLTCAKNGNEFTYRYYKKDFLTNLFAANDTVKALREGLLSVFGFFEKRINNKDSVYISGTYKKTAKEVAISFNGAATNGRSQANTSITLLTVCYTAISNTEPQQRGLIVFPVKCITVGVYGSMLDLGFTSSGGYSSGGGDGSGGGGSTGSNSFPDGFQCPQSEWWCESGDYIRIGDVYYTPLAYPGQNAGYSWLWWENYTFLQPYGGTDFGNWAINYLTQNPNIDFLIFQNQFLGRSEGTDGDYGASYWDDPNLTFPPQNLPSWSGFSTAYPTHKTAAEVYELVGGTPKALRDGVLNDSDPTNNHDYDNACALRVSKALNYSGVTIPNIPGKTFKGSDNKYYFLGAKNLNQWMRKTFGTNPATSTTPYNSNHHHYTSSQAGAHGSNLPGLLSGKKGIYSLVSSNPSWATGHADILYDNATCDLNCHFSDAPIAYIDIWELQ